MDNSARLVVSMPTANPKYRWWNMQPAIISKPIGVLVLPQGGGPVIFEPYKTTN